MKLNVTRECCIPQDGRSHRLFVILYIQEESNCSVYSKILKAVGVLVSVHTQSSGLIRIHFCLPPPPDIHTDLKNIKEASEVLEFMLACAVECFSTTTMISTAIAKV